MVRSGASKGSRFHSGSAGFTQTRLWVIRFIRVRLVHWGEPRGPWIHSGTLGFTRARLGVVGLIRVRVDSLGSA